MTCWLGSSHSSHHPAKFVDFVPCERKDKIFLIFHVTTQLKCHLNLCMDFPHPKSTPYSALRKWRYNIFDLSRDHVVNVSRDFVGEIPSS